MSAEMEINFDELDDTTEPQELMTAPDGGLDFSPDDLLAARSLQVYSVKSIICSLVARSVSVKYMDMTLPEETWPAKSYAAYCNFVGSMGSSRMTDRPLGVLVSSHVEELEQYHTNVLLASLLTEKTVVTRLVTDATLPAELAAIKGTIATQSPAGTVVMTVPGWGGEVHVSKAEDTRGRVISGGEEFCKWYNIIHKTALRYEKIIPVARDMAFAATVMFTLKMEKLELRVGDRPMTTKSGLPDVIGHLSRALEGRRKKMHLLLTKAWQNPANRPSMPSKDMRSFIECLFSRFVDGVTAVDRDGLYSVFDQVKADVDAQWLKLREIKIFQDLSTITKSDVVDVVAGRPVMGRVFANQGSIRAFVEESRNVFRDEADTVRKSDAYNLGSACGSSTSVPEKIQRCIDALNVLTGKTRYSGVDAFGTGAKNHWGPTIDRVAEDCKYYDRNGKYRPPLGEPFQERDIESIAPNSGVGRWVFDDTFNAPDNQETSVISKFNGIRKIRAIISAGYSGGFVKLYYGAGEDAMTLFKNVSPVVATLTAAYKKFYLIPGGTAHSPEYYVVFCRATSDGWAQAPMTPVGYTLDSVNVPAPKVEAAHALYIKNWFCYRAVEIIRANVIINVQLALGRASHIDSAAFTCVSPVEKIWMGGSVSPAVGNVVEATIDTSAADYDFLEGEDDHAEYTVSDGREMVADDDETTLSVGESAGGNKAGDGPFYVAAPSSTPRRRVRMAALRMVYESAAAPVRNEYPDYVPGQEETIFAVTFAKFVEVAPPDVLIRVNSPRYVAGYFESRGMGADDSTWTFRIIAYVPTDKSMAVCMYVKI